MSFQCKECSVVLADKQQLNNHVKNTHLITRNLTFKIGDETVIKEFRKDENGRFSCCFCQASFSDICNLRRHINGRCKGMEGTNIDDHVREEVEGVEEQTIDERRLAELGFSHVKELITCNVCFYDKPEGQFLLCLLCREGLGSLQSFQKHMQSVHNVKGLPYSRIRDLIGTNLMLKLPDEQGYSTEFPLLRVKLGWKCESGHISVAKKKTSCCSKSNCKSKIVSVYVQEIGGNKYEIQQQQQYPSNSMPLFSLPPEFLNSCTFMEEGEDVETRTSEALHLVVDTDKLFPSSEWTETGIQELKDTKMNDLIFGCCMSICEEAKDQLLFSTSVRSMLGNDTERFQFHQEERSVVKASVIAAKYLSTCISESLLAPKFCRSKPWPIIQVLDNEESLQEESLNQLKRHIVDFLIEQLLDPISICTSAFDIGLIKFLVFQNFSKERALAKANTITKSFSYMEYFMKICIAYNVMASSHDAGFYAEDFIKHCYQTSSVFQSMISVHSLFAKAARNDIRQPIFIDHGDYLTMGGQEIHTTNIQRFVQYQYNQCWQKLTYILSGYQMLEIPKGLQDNVRDKTKGMSVFSQNAYFVLKGGITIDTNWQLFTRHLLTRHQLVQGNQIVEAAVRSLYENQVADLALDILVLLHITGGSPSRKTELALTRVSNDLRYQRNIFMDGDNLYYALKYKKTSQGSGNWDPVYRFLPQPVATLLFNYVCLIRPAINCLMRRVDPSFIPNTKVYKVKTASDPIELSDRFSRSMAASIGVRMHFSHWRHLVQIYLRKDIVAAIANETLAQSIDLQAGRSYMMGVVQYGVGSGVMEGTTIDQLQRERSVSLAWHKIIGMSCGNLDVGVRCSIDSPIQRFGHGDGLGQQESLYVIPRFPARSYMVEDIIGALKELYGPSANVKSATQMEMLEKVIQGKDDMVVILPTGAGKSNTFLVPAKMYPSSTTIVFAPLVAVMSDIKRKATKMGIDVCIWNGPNTPMAPIILIHYQMPFNLIEDLLRWIDKVHSSRSLARIIFDECHELVEWSDFMNSTHLPCLRGLFKVPFIFQSATISCQTMELLLLKFGLSKETVEIIKDLSPRRNLRFLKIHADNVIDVALERIHNFFNTNPGDDERVLVFFPTIAAVDRFYEACTLSGISCSKYHGSMGSSRFVSLEQWKEAYDGCKTMVATKAMNSGVDYHAVHLVIVAEYVNTISDLVQSFGRGGRDGNPSDCILLSNPYAIGHIHAASELSSVFKSKECFRYELAKLIYSWGMPCKAISGIEQMSCSTCVTGGAIGVTKKRLAHEISDPSPSLIQNFVRSRQRLMEQIQEHGKFMESLDRMLIVCHLCFFTLGPKHANHAYEKCENPEKGRACKECGFQGHWVSECNLKDFVTVNACFKCWLPRQVGITSKHEDDEWGSNCRNVKYHELLKCWTNSIWVYRRKSEMAKLLIQNIVKLAGVDEPKESKDFRLIVLSHCQSFVDNCISLMINSIDTMAEKEELIQPVVDERPMKGDENAEKEELIQPVVDERPMKGDDNAEKEVQSRPAVAERPMKGDDNAEKEVQSQPDDNAEKEVQSQPVVAEKPMKVDDQQKSRDEKEIVFKGLAPKTELFVYVQGPTEGVRVFKNNITTLDPCQWLDDTVVTIYME